MINLSNFVLTQLTSFALAFFTAYLTVKFSLKKFFTEKWWERKADAYSNIVECLYHLKEYCDFQAAHDREGVQYSPERKKQLTDSYSKAYSELLKATGIGSYIICDEASAILDELKNREHLDWEDFPSWEIFDADAQSYNEVLEKIRKIAKKDLRVK